MGCIVSTVDLLLLVAFDHGLCKRNTESTTDLKWVASLTSGLTVPNTWVCVDLLRSFIHIAVACVNFPSADINSLVFNPFELNTDNNGIYDMFFNPDVNQSNINSLKLSCNYYSEEQVNTLYHNLTDTNIDNQFFSTFHLNICSMSKNHDGLKTFLSTLTYPFSALVFSETWMTDDLLSLYPLPNYTAFQSCRKNKRGGGVSLYVLNTYYGISREELSADFDTTNTESIFIEIPSCQQFNRNSILIGYRPPDSDINTFIDALHSTLEIINKEDKLCFYLVITILIC